MANKKLRAELEVDTSKARQKVREIAETGGGAAGGGTAGGGALPTDDLKRLGDAARETGSKLSSSGRMFAGLAMGMARAATAGGDQTTQAAVGAVGSIAAGAAMGGIPGAIAAAISEAVSAAIGADMAKSQQMMADAKTRSSNLDTFKAWEEARKQTQAFKETLEGLTSVETDLADRQKRLAEEIRKREKADDDLAREMIRESGDTAAFQRALAKRNANAAELDHLRGLKLETKKPSAPSSGGGSANWSGTDALDSVGGRFAAGGTVAIPDLYLSRDWSSPGQDVAPDAADGMESLADAGAEAEVEVLEKMSDSMDRQVELLKKIAENPKGGGMILWQ